MSSANTVYYFQKLQYKIRQNSFVVVQVDCDKVKVTYDIVLKAQASLDQVRVGTHMIHVYSFVLRGAANNIKDVRVRINLPRKGMEGGIEGQETSDN
jgi:hypothetical protein